MTAPDQTRRRPSGSLTVTIGPTNRVRSVQIANATDLRSPGALASAVAAAYSAALTARSRRDPESPQVRRTRPRAVAVRPTFQRPSPEQLQRHRIRNESQPGERRAAGAVDEGRSANGCVRVTLDPARSSGTVSADPGWLAHAGATSIAKAITEAFHHAYAERDHR